MAVYIPPVLDVEAIEKALGGCLKALTEDICVKHVKAAKEEIAEKLPLEAGRILAKLVQEVRSDSIIPHYSINIYKQNKEK